MIREFVMTAEFDKQWKAMELTDTDLVRLQQMILADPKIGPVMRGTGGLRKIRFPFEGRGKSGSARVAYIDFLFCERIYLISAYSKNEKENLTKEERNEIKKMIEAIEKSLKKGGAV